jgi:hypothetical protein
MNLVKKVAISTWLLYNQGLAGSTGILSRRKVRR